VAKRGLPHTGWVSTSGGLYFKEIINKTFYCALNIKYGEILLGPDLGLECLRVFKRTGPLTRGYLIKGPNNRWQYKINLFWKKTE